MQPYQFFYMRCVNNYSNEQVINNLVVNLKKKYNSCEFIKLKSLLNSRKSAVINRICYKFPAIPLDASDYYLLADELLWTCINTYAIESKYNFSQFYLVKLKSRLIDYVRTFLKMSHLSLNYAVHFSSELNEIMPCRNVEGMPERFCNSKHLFDLINNCKNVSDNDLDLFWLKQQGYKNNELCDKFKLSPRQVDNIYQRVKLKLQIQLKVWN